MFNPTEIIFAATDACNLHCPHCFVNRNAKRLSVEDAISFLETVKQTVTDCTIERIGFSGGEPFLYTDFLCEIIKWTVKNELMFDQIMTNGDWWKDEEELNAKLKLIYDAGYDGKIGLSYDSFHGQTEERIKTFVAAAEKYFGERSVNIQTVKSSDKTAGITKNKKITVSTIKKLLPDTDIYILPQTFESENKKAWKSLRWFKDDYCEGPGQILYIHPDGNIAPCCGFANENKKLFIGNIKQTFAEVMKQAQENRIVKICYEQGLGNYRKQIKKAGHKFPGKTNDICSFCDYVCKLPE